MKFAISVFFFLISSGFVFGEVVDYSPIDVKKPEPVVPKPDLQNVCPIGGCPTQSVLQNSCPGGVCPVSGAGYVYPSMRNGWYPGKLIGRILGR